MKGSFEMKNQEFSSMQAKLTVGAIVVMTMLLSAPPLAAHHAFAAEFDANKPVHFHGRNRHEGRIYQSPQLDSCRREDARWHGGELGD